MERCPTCGANFRGESPCHRCGTELQKILAIERLAAQCRLQSRRALDAGRLGEAESQSRRACALHRSAESLVDRARVAVTTRDFPLALALWRETRRGGPAGPE